jgi:hypothetical protein
MIALVLVIVSTTISANAAPLNNEIQPEVSEQVVVAQTEPQANVTETLNLVEPVVVEIPQPKIESSCVSEIKKYDWNQTVAYEVMMVESKNNHKIVNDNASTGDYSIGCFQINLYGNLRKSRPDESWLKVPENNVAYAYQMWKSQGWKPWSHTTCRYKVSCY